MVFKDYNYSGENYILDNGSNAVKVDNNIYNNEENLKHTKVENKYITNKKKNKGLIFLLVKYNTLLITALIFILGFTIISRDGKVYKLQNELSRVNNEISNVVSENEALEIKILKSISLDDIASIAKERLKMTFPGKDDILNLNN